MNYLLAYLPDAYLKQSADYFAAEHPPRLLRRAPSTVDAAEAPTRSARRARAERRRVAQGARVRLCVTRRP